MKLSIDDKRAVYESIMSDISVMLKNIINEGTETNKIRKVKLTPEIIHKYKNRTNMLIHLQEDVDGIAMFDSDKLIGYVGYKGEWIKGIWVDKDYRELHLGSKLLKYAVKKGATHSSVNNKNKVSLKFHKKNGFEEYKNDGNMTYLIKK